MSTLWLIIAVAAFAVMAVLLWFCAALEEDMQGY